MPGESSPFTAGLLLDTCTLIWLASEPARLGSKAKTALDADGAVLVLSDVSILEITLKWHAAKLHLPEPPRQWLETQASRWRLKRLELQRRHVYRASELPDHHRDPFDRLLIAQALEESLELVTPDPLIRRYPVVTVW